MKLIRLFVILLGSTQKPEYLYRVIEHLIQGRRRIELFGVDHNLQPGWLTVGNVLSSSNFGKEVMFIDSLNVHLHFQVQIVLTYYPYK